MRQKIKHVNHIRESGVNFLKKISFDCVRLISRMDFINMSTNFYPKKRKKGKQFSLTKS